MVLQSSPRVDILGGNRRHIILHAAHGREQVAEEEELGEAILAQAVEDVLEPRVLGELFSDVQGSLRLIPGSFQVK